MPFFNYLPIVTLTLSLIFSVVMFNHWRRKPGALYLFWWMIGLVTYGAGTLTESINTLTGFHPLNFRMWYITGALLGGAPLAQGTVYLLMKRKTANLLTIFFLAIFTVSAILALTLSYHYTGESTTRLSSYKFDSTLLLINTILINTYALLFLVGGAIWSAWKYFRLNEAKNRFRGNVLIAIGAFLPGIGGTFTHFGHVEVLYITELIGLMLILSGYWIIRQDNVTSIHTVQQG